MDNSLIVQSENSSGGGSQESADIHAHLFDRRRILSPTAQRLFKKFSESYCMSFVLEYLGQRQSLYMQQLSKFYYKVQIPRSMGAIIEIKLRKVRLHLFNHDYIILFNMQTWTKEKRMLRNESVPHIWNCQSIEVRGQVYITGGSIANTKTYLKSVYKVDEGSWKLEPLADMQYARDAHGIISWRNQYIIVVGSWHVEQSTKTCEMYDCLTNKWLALPELNYSTCAPGMIIVKDRYLYKLGGTTNIRKLEFLDLQAVLLQNEVQKKNCTLGLSQQSTQADPVQWITINTSNSMGKKSSINRCLLH